MILLVVKKDPHKPLYSQKLATKMNLMLCSHRIYGQHLLSLLHAVLSATAEQRRPQLMTPWWIGHDRFVDGTATNTRALLTEKQNQESRLVTLRIDGLVVFNLESFGFPAIASAAPQVPW